MSGEQPEAINETLYATARAWPAGLDLKVAGIDLADTIEYDVLRVFGGLFKSNEQTNEVIGDGPAPATN